MPNESLMHADAFFFISTIALVVISIGLAIALYYLIKILRDIRIITDKVKIESAEIVADVKKFRTVIREEGVKWKVIAQMVRAFFSRDAARRPSRKKTEHEHIKKEE